MCVCVCIWGRVFGGSKGCVVGRELYERGGARHVYHRDASIRKNGRVSCDIECIARRPFIIYVKHFLYYKYIR